MLCPRCQRANPDEARFCHFDGAELQRNGAALHYGPELGREFVFPTGRRCRTYDELLRACSEDWDSARSLLKQGSLRQFLSGVGRMDLAQAADRAAAEPDGDVALDSFLSQLPVLEPANPRLDILPRRLHVGKMTIGQTRQYTVAVFNQGFRLLTGSIRIEGGDWVRLAPGTGPSFSVKAGKQQQINVVIDPAGLPAGQKYTAKLTIISNGGAVEIPVRIDLQAVPFPRQPLQGAANPRELAGRMKDQPKGAVTLLENGEVQRWFAANGWNYPVEGRPAKGIAAVQQFFESMGLSRPPPLTVSEQEIRLKSSAWQPVRSQVHLRTAARKWVYAHIESDSPWLKVLNPDVSGPQQAAVEFEVSARGLQDDRPQVGHLAILANGKQKFRITINADLRGRSSAKAVSLVRPAVIGGLAGFLLRLAVSLPDLYLRGPAAFGSWVADVPPDYVAKFTLITAGVGLVLAGLWVRRHGGGRDLPAALVVGAATGLAVGITLGSFIKALDSVLYRLAALDSPGLAIAGWTLGGAVGGVLLALFGRPGNRVLAGLGHGLGWITERLGMGSAAGWLRS